MFRYIFAFFGYVKVPKAAVRLNIWVEDSILKLSKDIDPKTVKVEEYFKQMHESCRTITRFLQSGRMLQ